MKYLLVLTLSLMLMAAVAPMPAEASLILGSKEYTLKYNERVNDDLYVGAGTAAVAGVVDGDLSLGGGTILYSGSTTGDVLVAGGTVNISGAIDGDLRIIGGTVTIGGKVHGDVAVIGGQVRLESTGVVDGDLLVAGGQVRIDGPVVGKVYAGGGAVRVDSVLQSDLLVAADSITIEKGSRIGGDFHYRAPQKAVIESGALVDGKTIYKESRKLSEIGTTSLRESLFAFLSLWIILKFIMTALVALIIVLLFNHLAEEIIQQAVTRPWRSVLIGFALLVSIPAAALVTLITIVGAPLGILALLAYGFFLMLSIPLGAIMLGTQLIQYLNKSSLVVVDWRAALLGVLLYTLIGFIPFLGWIAQYALMLASFGALSHYWNEYIWRNR